MLAMGHEERQTRFGSHALHTNMTAIIPGLTI